MLWSPRSLGDAVFRCGNLLGSSTSSSVALSFLSLPYGWLGWLMSYMRNVQADTFHYQEEDGEEMEALGTWPTGECVPSSSSLLGSL